MSESKYINNQSIFNSLTNMIYAINNHHDLYCEFIKPSDEIIMGLRRLSMSENKKMGLCWMDLSMANETKRVWPNIFTLRKILKEKDRSDYTFNVSCINDAMIHVSLSEDPDAWTVEEILRLPGWLLVG